MKKFHYELVVWKFASADKEQDAMARSSGVYMEILEQRAPTQRSYLCAIVEFTMH
jgi:hypothetical protein